MSWVAVAVGAGSALIGGAASLAGSKKQADAAKGASNLQMQMFERLNAQQQPYIQSGYGAMGRLNTLLGLGGRRAPAAGQPAYVPTPGGGIDQRIPRPVGRAQGASLGQSARLKQILALRAANGDTEAARIMESV